MKKKLLKAFKIIFCLFLPLIVEECTCNKGLKFGVAPDHGIKITLSEVYKTDITDEYKEIRCRVSAEAKYLSDIKEGKAFVALVPIKDYTKAFDTNEKVIVSAYKNAMDSTSKGHKPSEYFKLPGYNGALYYVTDIKEKKAGTKDDIKIMLDLNKENVGSIDDFVVIVIYLTNEGVFASTDKNNNELGNLSKDSGDDKNKLNLLLKHDLKVNLLATQCVFDEQTDDFVPTDDEYKQKINFKAKIEDYSHTEKCLEYFILVADKLPFDNETFSKELKDNNYKFDGKDFKTLIDTNKGEFIPFKYDGKDGYYLVPIDDKKPSFAYTKTETPKTLDFKGKNLGFGVYTLMAFVVFETKEASGHTVTQTKFSPETASLVYNSTSMDLEPTPIIAGNDIWDKGKDAVIFRFCPTYDPEHPANKAASNTTAAKAEAIVPEQFKFDFTTEVKTNTPNAFSVYMVIVPHVTGVADKGAIKKDFEDKCKMCSLPGGIPTGIYGPTGPAKTNGLKTIKIAGKDCMIIKIQEQAAKLVAPGTVNAIETSNPKWEMNSLDGVTLNYAHFWGTDVPVAGRPITVKYDDGKIRSGGKYDVFLIGVIDNPKGTKLARVSKTVATFKIPAIYGMECKAPVNPRISTHDTTVNTGFSTSEISNTALSGIDSSLWPAMALPVASIPALVPAPPKTGSILDTAVVGGIAKADHYRIVGVPRVAGGTANRVTLGYDGDGTFNKHEYTTRIKYNVGLALPLDDAGILFDRTAIGGLNVGIALSDKETVTNLTYVHELYKRNTNASHNTFDKKHIVELSKIIKDNKPEDFLDIGDAAGAAQGHYYKWFNIHKGPVDLAPNLPVNVSGAVGPGPNSIASVGNGADGDISFYMDASSHDRVEGGRFCGHGGSKELGKNLYKKLSFTYEYNITVGSLFSGHEYSQAFWIKKDNLYVYVVSEFKFHTYAPDFALAEQRFRKDDVSKFSSSDMVQTTVNNNNIDDYVKVQYGVVIDTTTKGIPYSCTHLNPALSDPEKYRIDVRSLGESLRIVMFAVLRGAIFMDYTGLEALLNAGVNGHFLLRMSTDILVINTK